MLLLSLLLFGGDLADLGSPECHVREQAELRLSARAALSWPACRAAVLTHRSPEVRRRASRVVARALRAGDRMTPVPAGYHEDEDEWTWRREPEGGQLTVPAPPLTCGELAVMHLGVPLRWVLRWRAWREDGVDWSRPVEA
jgi:hypothetical protein